MSFAFNVHTRLLEEVTGCASTFVFDEELKVIKDELEAVLGEMKVVKLCLGGGGGGCALRPSWALFFCLWRGRMPLLRIFVEQPTVVSGVGSEQQVHLRTDGAVDVR